MPGIVTALNGVSQVVANMRAKQEAIGKKVEAGLKKAGLRLQAASQNLVPVNFGVLKASAFTRATGSGWNTKVTVGYTANYALYVHEAVEMKLQGKPRPQGRGFFWDPQGQAQAKFLEAPSRSLRPEILQIIKDATK